MTRVSLSDGGHSATYLAAGVPPQGTGELDVENASCRLGGRTNLIFKGPVNIILWILSSQKF